MPTAVAGGAWNDDEIHFSPLGGLVVHALEAHLASQGRTGLQLGRVTFDILGFLAADACEITVETIRPGRTIELLEATVTIRGRAAVRARAWYLAEAAVSEVAGGGPAPLPAPDTADPWSLQSIWTGGFVASVELRAVTPPEPGRACVWLRSPVPLVVGESSSPTSRFIALVDTANGIAPRESPQEWAFPNIDLTIHLVREPIDGWVGLDTAVTFGPNGLGLTSTVLHDMQGPVGTAQQVLVVRPR